MAVNTPEAHTRRRYGLTILVGLSMVLSLPALADSSSPGGTFVDDNGNTHEGAIEAIASEGVTLGCNPPSNTESCPSEDVSRAQMAAFLARAFDLTADTHPGFNDVPGGHTFSADIGRLATAGITLGCNPPDNDEFCPGDAMWRDQMASFLARALEAPQTIPPPVVTFEPGTHAVGSDIPPGVYRNSGFAGGLLLGASVGLLGGSGRHHRQRVHQRRPDRRHRGVRHRIQLHGCLRHMDQSTGDEPTRHSFCPG